MSHPQTKAEIEASREAGTPSPWRERSIEENLKLFDDMRKGLYKEGEATLRMKMDYKNENPNMWDSVAYRWVYRCNILLGLTYVFGCRRGIQE